MKRLTKGAVDKAVETVAYELPFAELRLVVTGDPEACAAHDAKVKSLLDEQGYDTAGFEMSA